VIQPSDQLHLRTGLPVQFRYLEPAFPRPDWPTLQLHPTARHWLEIHDWFRAMMADLAQLGGEWREGRLEAAAYRQASIPRLRQLLGNLHGHHSHESGHYFPALSALEPDMARGFDLLDRDHDAIEHLLSDMAQAGNALNQAAAEGRDLFPQAAALTESSDQAGLLIGRHLLDEEEIIVPVLSLRGDPFQG